jgi:hypothetical protein
MPMDEEFVEIPEEQAELATMLMHLLERIAKQGVTAFAYVAVDPEGVELLHSPVTNEEIELITAGLSKLSEQLNELEPVVGSPLIH